MLTSCVCRFEDFLAPWYAEWREYVDRRPPGTEPYHRKTWEHAAIAQALQERGCLAPGKRGIGFAVGVEPLVSLFAAHGPKILATDQADGAEAEPWKGGQYAGNKAGLFDERLIGATEFADLVSFRNVDMRVAEQFPRQKFDFVWSSCAFEHLGSIEAGAAFVRASTRLLKPGGVAVHTTEFNVSSDEKTVESGSFVLYRKRDLLRLSEELTSDGFLVSPFNSDPGSHQHDREPDTGPPWYVNGRQHVKLKLGGFVATSALLIVERPAEGSTP